MVPGPHSTFDGEKGLNGSLLDRSDDEMTLSPSDEKLFNPPSAYTTHITTHLRDHVLSCPCLVVHAHLYTYIQHTVPHFVSAIFISTLTAQTHLRSSDFRPLYAWPVLYKQWSTLVL